MRVREDLGENDRSATGFLPPPEFERMADAFFANPTVSVRGWERAVDVQARIVAAVRAVAAAEEGAGDILVAAHGAVGALLDRCRVSSSDLKVRIEKVQAGDGVSEPQYPPLKKPPGALRRSILRFRVFDTGKGIPTGRFRRVFRPGYTTKTRGWGLGLSLAKRIVETYHKGRIFVKSSAPGKGTTFAILLPRQANSDDPEMNVNNS